MDKSIEIAHAKFMGSWEKNEQLPEISKPEFAFIGRSNVGKSSLINMLCNRKGLAKTSGQPGKTQSINLFDIESALIFCDLPGYGYAKVSKKLREKFSRMISHYLKNRANLYCLFILIDLRIPMQQIDLDFIDWCGENQIPFCLIGTKSDALKGTKLDEKIVEMEQQLSATWAELPPIFVSSSTNGAGKQAILNYIFNN